MTAHEWASLTVVVLVGVRAVRLSDDIVQIDPATGKVVAFYDMSTLYPIRQRSKVDDVLNGIAFDQEEDVFYLTGKNWSKYYKVGGRPVRDPPPTVACMPLPWMGQQPGRTCRRWLAAVRMMASGRGWFRRYGCGAADDAAAVVGVQVAFCDIASQAKHCQKRLRA